MWDIRFLIYNFLIYNLEFGLLSLEIIPYLR